MIDWKDRAESYLNENKYFKKRNNTLIKENKKLREQIEKQLKFLKEIRKELKKCYSIPLQNKDCTVCDLEVFGPLIDKIDKMTKE